MNPNRRLYYYAAPLFVFAFYQLYLRDFWEFSLYTVAGIAFVANGLTYEPSLSQYKKTLVVVSWILIFVTGILFLYLLQFKFL